ncbi:MAG TPA: RuBisCO large subunit C-terminal-like domain-containing protein [Planctomycetota bacterium]|nr:RuBisCO large subunit C-terminal-like domain-containing protein [Planctomycetota bacterium]
MDERFTVIYRIAGTEPDALSTAKDICLEQTVEMPVELLAQLLTKPVADWVCGWLERFAPVGPELFEAAISYPVEATGFEIPHLLCVAFGNYSMKPGVRVDRLTLPASLLSHFRGPRFGRAGLRQWVHAPDRPLLLASTKPMGRSARELAELVYSMALGGIDLIKDDQGLGNQPFSPFCDRVEQCAEAVRRANRETGWECAYMPNVTGPSDQIHERAIFAKSVGARGLLLLPGLTGFDVVREIAEDDGIALPVVIHPAFLGSLYVTPTSGLSPVVIFGQLARLTGADASIFVNWTGRFNIPREECAAIARATAEPMGNLSPMFPAPSSSITPAQLTELRQAYGNDVVYVMGRGLYQGGRDLATTSRACREILERVPG